MANKVFNMAGGRHSAAAYSAFEDALYGSCVAADTDFVCTAGTGMTVQLTAGDGLISTGSRYARRIQADATNTITITAASATLPRTDAIVAYIDNAVTPSTSYTDNTNGILKFVAVAGTPASTPSAPNSTTIQSSVGAGNPYMVLWEVTVPAGATALNTATFTDKRTFAGVTDGSITTDKLASSAVSTAKIADDAVTADKIDWTTIQTVVAPKPSSGTSLSIQVPAGKWKIFGTVMFVQSNGTSGYEQVGLQVGSDDRRQNIDFVATSSARRGCITVADWCDVNTTTTIILSAPAGSTLRYSSCSLFAERYY